MGTMTKFQKQLIAALCLLLLAGAVFAAHFLNRGSRDGGMKTEKPLFPFTGEETEAIRAFEGSAAFTFKDEKEGATDPSVAVYMRLAEGYASLNRNIKAEYGKGSRDCVLTVNGNEHVPDREKLCLTLKDGTPYATTARAYFNRALFGGELGAPAEAFEGYDTDGDRVNGAGLAYLYGPIGRDEIKYIHVENEHGKLTFIPVGGAFYLTDTQMDMSTAVVATLVAAARAPVAESKVAHPGTLADYGLDGEGAKAVVIVQETSGEAHGFRVGKRLPDGSGYYALCFGKDTVYVLPGSIENYILPPKESFLKANYGTKLAEMTDVFRKVDDICFNLGGELVKATLMTEAEKKNHSINYSWKVTAPDRLVSGSCGYTLPNFFNIGDVLNKLCALTADKVLDADADAEALKKYGLDKPYRSYSWLYDGRTRCTVHFSAPDKDGSCFVYSVKENVKTGEKATVGIGLVSRQSFPYLEYGVLNFLDTKLYTHYFDELERVEFSRKGKDYVVDIYKDAEGKAVSAFLNGEKRELPDCQNFYRGLLHCSILEEYEGEGAPPKEIFKIKLCTKTLTREFVFGRLSSMKAYCRADGKAEYLMDYSMLETLVSGADKLIAGETIEWKAK